VPVAQERVFTHIARGRTLEGEITAAKIAEVAKVAGEQLRRAHELGAEHVTAVATAAVRRAANSAELVAFVAMVCGLQVVVLSGEEEARLAFRGAASALVPAPDGQLGVADIGGGSSELVVGTPPDRIAWSASFDIGSSDITAAWLDSDPPSAEELERARGHIASTFEGLAVPTPATAVAVGGSATSLRLMAGGVLDAPALRRTLDVLVSHPSTVVATRFGLDPDRARLMPAGVLILEAASRAFALPLEVGGGGLREGILLEGLAA